MKPRKADSQSIRHRSCSGIFSNKKISIKWKIFIYLLGFMAILLAMLWLFQIAYLDTFYKIIRTHDAKNAKNQVVYLLETDAGDLDEQIDELAAAGNLAVLVTDKDGEALYSAEYIINSRMNMLSKEEFKRYYQTAMDNGGSAEVEYEGTFNRTFDPDFSEENSTDPSARDQIMESGQDEGEGNEHTDPIEYFQNHGQPRVESVVYVSIVHADGQEYVVMINAQLTPLDATTYTLKVQLVCISVIVTFLALIIALLISRRITRSIIKVNQSAKELAEGNYGVSFFADDFREIAELSDTLNFASRELEKTENLRRELIANVSHDLRTPLTMITAYAEVMRDLPGENSPENVQVVIDEAKRLTGLVNDMLDLSRLQAGVMEIKAEEYNLTDSIRSVLKRYNKLMEQEGYEITFHWDREVMVSADEYKICQVIYNLVNNAIQYTGQDKKVIVRQKVMGESVRIEVEDDGDGIAGEDLPFVWDRYYKVDKTHKRAVVGTGLGLSIVKKILELHGASYGVESEQNKGSIFWFEMKILPE